MAGQEVGGYNFSAGLSSLLGNVKSGESTVADSPKSEPSAQPGDGKLKISGEVAAKFERMNQEFDRILESWADKLGIQHGELKTHLDRVRLAYEIASALQKSDPAGYQDFLKQVETAGAPFKVNLGLARSEGGKPVALNSGVELKGDYGSVNKQLLTQFTLASGDIVSRENSKDQLESQSTADEFGKNVQLLLKRFGPDGEFKANVASIIEAASDSNEAPQDVLFRENMNKLAAQTQDRQFQQNVMELATLLPVGQDSEFSRNVQSLPELTGVAAKSTPPPDGRSSVPTVDAKHLANAKAFIDDNDTNGDRLLGRNEVKELLAKSPAGDLGELYARLDRHIEQVNGGKPLTAEQLAAFMASEAERVPMSNPIAQR